MSSTKENETIKDISESLRKSANSAFPYDVESMIIYNTIADRIDAAIKREHDLIRSCSRWILAHDIYGHMSKELLAECKKVLGDDGQFLNK